MGLSVHAQRGGCQVARLPKAISAMNQHLPPSQDRSGALVHIAKLFFTAATPIKVIIRFLLLPTFMLWTVSGSPHAVVQIAGVVAATSLTLIVIGAFFWTLWHRRESLDSAQDRQAQRKTERKCQSARA